MDQTLKFKSQRAKPIKLPQENPTASKINSMVFDFGNHSDGEIMEHSNYLSIWQVIPIEIKCSHKNHKP